MDANIIIAAGYPHELLGLLRRMPGIQDLNLLQDSDGFAQAFASGYADETEYINIINIACKLGVIAEMSSIIDEPMWRKRSFINKSVIQLTSEKRMKEYQACEILESFMQIFGWDFEVKVARRWEVSEEETIEYHKSRNVNAYAEKERASRKSIKEEKPSVYKQEHNDGNNEEEKNADNNEVNDAVSTKVEKGAGEYNYNERNAHKQQSAYLNNEPHQKNDGRKVELQASHIRQQTRQEPIQQSKQQLSKERELEKKRQTNEVYKYADEDNIYDRDAYIKNEILKGGIKFENLMSNAMRRDVRSAIKGNSEAQYRMGKYYSESNTKHTDYEEALKWYRVSASQGNKKAQFELGMLYDGGKVKCKDYKKQAMKCYLGLAESGFPTAQCMVGMKYKFGDGVDEDINEAIKWFKKAAMQGHTDAQRNLGDTYMAIGKKDEAVKWYERAAAAGDIYSEKMLGTR